MPVVTIALSASTIAAQADPKGAPAAITQFFDATKIDSRCPNDTTCVYTETFLTGATREITLTVSPGQRFLAGRAIPGSFPISDFKFSSSADADSTIRIRMSYYVANAGLPNNGASAQAPWLRSKNRGGLAIVQLASFGTNEPRGFARMLRAAADGGGAGVDLSELTKRGKDSFGPGLGPLSTIYGLASAVKDVSTALDMGSQSRKWLRELDALEKCAASPTNRVSISDPNYSRKTVAMIQAARGELKEVTAVRFLNQMTKKAAGLTPVTKFLGIGLKAGFDWSEQTLGDFSENTIMREARLAVVKCVDPGDAAGNLTLVSECTTQNGKDHTVTKLTANVSWEWQMGVKYLPRGTYTYKSVRTVGPACTQTSTASGSVDDTGWLFIFNQQRSKELGYGYEARFVNLPAQVTTSIAGNSNCGIAGTNPMDIDWIPVMHGYLGTGGAIEGEMPGPACNVGQPSTLKWSFTAAAPKR